MKLEHLLANLNSTNISGPIDREITAIAYDSRRVKPGSLFVALPGQNHDGSQFIEQSIAAGAEAIVSTSSGFRTKATHIVVPNTRFALADIAATFYKNPSHSLKVAGVTGTNGKTTTTFLLKHICETELRRCGLIGTVRYEVGDRILPATRTTPESLDVQNLLWQMHSAGCKAVAMEVSSHALDQSRVRGVEFDTAIFTNLTQDHLDYHQTMDAYYEAKSQLFTGLSSQKKKIGKAVLNIDDRYGSQLATRIEKDTALLTYGVSARADFRASNVRIDFNGTSYQLDAEGKSYLVRLPQIGQFNVYNSLSAIAGASALGIEVRQSVLALAKAPPVPGRLEAVPAQRNFRVFVDYAHTDDALKNVLKTCRELHPARLIVVFGCGGSRDRSKRPKMGAVVDQYADFAFVTSDNPRQEDPREIIAEIEPGLAQGRYDVVVDRKEAIFKAISLAGPRDIVLIAGKGHEAYQEFADHTAPFDDVAIATQALEAKSFESIE